MVLHKLCYCQRLAITILTTNSNTTRATRATHRSYATANAQNYQQHKTESSSDGCQQCADSRQAGKHCHHPLPTVPLRQNAARNLRNKVSIEKCTKNVSLYVLLPHKWAILVNNKNRTSLCFCTRKQKRTNNIHPSYHHYQQTKTQLFAGQMSFLSPNQHC